MPQVFRNGKPVQQTPGAKAPPSTSRSSLARAVERASHALHNAVSGPAKVRAKGKEMGAETGANFRSAAESRGAALRELMGDTTPRAKKPKS